MKRWTALPLVLAITSYACGASTSLPSTSKSAPQTTTRPEHLSWSQAAASDAELASIRFAIYLDGSRSELSGFSCAASATQGIYDCSAPLPTLAPGSHTLQMASYYVGFEQTENLSPPLVFLVGTSSTPVSLD
jgi:hypothetical protein